MKNKVTMLLITAFCMGGLLGCGSGQTSDMIPTDTPTPIATAVSVAPTSAPEPTATSTPAPTNTQVPTVTPEVIPTTTEAPQAEEPTHIHNWELRKRGETCTADGKTWQVCECGAIQKEEVLPMTGHDLETIIEKEATTEEEGAYALKCKTCRTVVERGVIEKLEVTDTPEPVPTNTPIPTNTPVPTATSTQAPTATSTPVPTATSTPAPTATSTPAPTATSTPAPTATNTPKPTATPTPAAPSVDASQYLVYEYFLADQDKNYGDSVELYTDYDEGTSNEYNINTDLLNYGALYHYDSYQMLYTGVYEFTERPSYAGNTKTITLSDKDLLPENLLKYNIQVGDIITTESFTYEQDGNTGNGKEAIVWEVVKVQYIYTVHPREYSASRAYRGKLPLYMNGANLSASYYLRAVNTLDYDEYFKFENYTKLYSGTALTNQTYANKYHTNDLYGCSEGHDTFVYDSLQGADVNFRVLVRGNVTGTNNNQHRMYWNTCNTTAYTGMISILKSEGANMQSKPTKYALSKGIPTTSAGYVQYNWLFGVSPYLLNGKPVWYKGLSVSDTGSLKWNNVFADKSGFRPELTLVTGVDTAAIHTDYDLKLAAVKDGSWRESYEINYDIWKDYEAFVRWDIPQ